jgi:hypothetical protein
MLLLLLALQNPVVPGEIRSHATPTSIAIEWDLTGDKDHDATCAVEVRPKGAAEWKKVLPLFRVDYHGWYDDTKADRAYNMVAGSLLFLKPGTIHEVKLDLVDPDGGGVSKTLEIRTRDLPKLPEGGRTFRVTPGDGGGDGTEANPFKGLREAKNVARPGDIFLLGAGDYGAFPFSMSGEPGKYVVWKSEKPGGAVFKSVHVYGSHVWLEGFAFRKVDTTNALRGYQKSTDVVVRRCDFQGFHYSVHLTKEVRDWTIEDNVIVGDNDPVTGGLSGEGVELAMSEGHVVAHNRISRTADGVSYPGRNCDVYGNDIFDVSDDGIEPDYGYANNRFWGNRLTNLHNAAISFQPMYCGPWYYIRNQMVGAGQIFKYRVQDRFVLANNTFVTWGHQGSYMHHVLTSLSRNNLYISADGKKPLWLAVDYNERKYTLVPQWTKDWRTDVDYDGFDWGECPEPFRWGEKGSTKRWKDLAELSKALGVEEHAVRVRKEEIFEKWTVPADPGRVDPSVLLTLKPGSNAVDAGAAIPGLVDDFAGKAPDLGALESDKPLPLYGPRP